MSHRNTRLRLRRSNNNLYSKRIVTNKDNRQIFKDFQNNRLKKSKNRFLKLRLNQVQAENLRGSTSGNVLRKPVKIRVANRENEIKPFNIPKFSTGLNRRLKGLFNF